MRTTTLKASLLALAILLGSFAHASHWHESAAVELDCVVCFHDSLVPISDNGTQVQVNISGPRRYLLTIPSVLVADDQRANAIRAPPQN